MKLKKSTKNFFLMNGLTAKLKKNDNKGIFTQLGITGNDVTSRHVTCFYLTRIQRSSFREKRESEPLTKNYSGVGGRTSDWTPVADRRKNVFGSLKPNFLQSRAKLGSSHLPSSQTVSHTSREEISQRGI